MSDSNTQDGPEGEEFAGKFVTDEDGRRELHLNLDAFDPETPSDRRHRALCFALLRSIQAEPGEGIGLDIAPQILRFENEEDYHGFAHFASTIIETAEDAALARGPFAAKMLQHTLSHVIDEEDEGLTVPGIDEAVSTCRSHRYGAFLLRWMHTNRARVSAAIRKIEQSEDDMEELFDEATGPLDIPEENWDFWVQGGAMYDATARAFLQEQSEILWACYRYIWTTVQADAFPFDEMPTLEDVEAESKEARDEFIRDLMKHFGKGDGGAGSSPNMGPPGFGGPMGDA